MIEHAALERYTPDGYVQALEQAIAQLKPEQVFLPHTYQTRDFAPKLAARLDRALITDCVGVKRDDGRASFYRPVFQGKLIAEVVAGRRASRISSRCRSARTARDAAARGAAAAPVEAAERARSIRHRDSRAA